ncbi:hypothetical protein LAUMK13_05596 [Mycobacterium innocens]|uniref:Uncharacterized protein n=1 Tax=Mycobacterium innocens TaxID=2341083 RepID=A0A498QK17_9MYCO|nr:hypothetical protein LAUMK13_05596 [Mycobacterium innocens]
MAAPTTDEQKTQWLPGIIRGDVSVAIAMIEPDATAPRLSYPLQLRAGSMADMAT